MHALIGEGRTAEVFDIGDGLALKLFRAGFEDVADHEAGIARTITGLALPAPRLHRAMEEAGRKGLVYDRIDGESMLRRLFDNPMAIRRYAHMMAALQHAVHQRDAADRLPPLKDRLRRDIGSAPGLDAERRAAVLARLDALPDGTRVCHYDLHPDNILLRGETPILIDWPNAVAGDPAADVCRTSLIAGSTILPPDTPHHLRGPIARFRESMQRQYLQEYLRLSGIAQAQVERWYAPVAAARMREAIDGEQPYLLACIDRSLA